jgi:pyrroloquinoline quinone biosynthesis protein B
MLTLGKIRDLRNLRIAIILITFQVLISCVKAQEPYILVLGVAQDGGYPHLGCEKECCKAAWENPELKRFVVSLALVDPASQKWFLFEASPDMSDQIQFFRELTGGSYNYLPDAIFVSHAHIGHYTGLMELGKEAMNSDNVPVYALPRMTNFLKDNGPWSQLVSLNNISLKEVKAGSSTVIAENIKVTLIEVPHRDEYSETAAYRINAGVKTYLFIPDIDKWNKWDRSIIKEVQEADIAFIDGTFYSEAELPGRNMSDIPHPFIVETMALFSEKAPGTKIKIKFIHLNHSNPALSNQDTLNLIKEKGFEVAVQGRKY